MLSALMKRYGSGLKTLTVVLLCLSQTSCLKWFRVAEFGLQFCNFDGHFALQYEQPQPVLWMRDPVLLKSDVDDLLGVTPTQIYQLPDQALLRAGYYFVNREDSRTDRPIFGFELEYLAPEEDWRLYKGIGDEKVSRILPLALVEQGFRALCSRNTDYSLSRIRFGLTNIDRSLLPNQGEITALLGPSAYQSESLESDRDFTPLQPAEPLNHRLGYEFDKIGDDNNPGRMKMEIGYAKSGEVLIIQARYSQYEFAVDFTRQRATVYRL
ncbi:MAG: hypothetical protein MI864_23845 [Pseudomonadales bacterium]|nr:hypothetical protein [Pseudomonadales bacterium]